MRSTILEAVILLMTLGCFFQMLVDHFVPSVPVSLIQVVFGAWSLL